MKYQPLAIIRLIGLIVLSLAMWNSAALAYDHDVKIYPGSLCTDMLGPGGTDNLGQTYLNYRSDGSVSNKGGQDPFGPQENIGPFLAVTCPVVRDEHDDAKISAVSIWYTNNDPAREFGCTIYMKSMGHDVSTSKPATGKVGPINTVLEIDYIPNPTNSSKNVFYYLTCLIPNPTEQGESIIHAYEIVEYIP